MKHMMSCRTLRVHLLGVMYTTVKPDAFAFAVHNYFILKYLHLIYSILHKPVFHHSPALPVFLLQKLVEREAMTRKIEWCARCAWTMRSKWPSFPVATWCAVLTVPPRCGTAPSAGSPSGAQFEATWHEAAVLQSLTWSGCVKLNWVSLCKAFQVSFWACGWRGLHQAKLPALACLEVSCETRCLLWFHCCRSFVCLVWDLVGHGQSLRC